MRNPWLRLPRKVPFVLPQDAAAIEAFNQTATETTRYCLDLIPEPFLGSPSAPIVLLSLNPGLTNAGPEIHSATEFARLARANLMHEPSDYPFYLLNPDVPETSPGRTWWEHKLARLIAATSRRVVANHLLCVEYVGYHSKQFKQYRQPHLPSQQYGFWLVRQAISRGAVIVQMRSHAVWLRAVPELVEYTRRFVIRNVQKPVISPGNCPDGYDEIVALLLSNP